MRVIVAPLPPLRARQRGPVDDALVVAAVSLHDDGVARNLGEATGPVAPAARATRPGWRDPRLWVGVAIVAACVVAGARLLAAADETVPVWAAATDMGVGDRVTATDLVAARVRFADDHALEGYFTVAEDLPADMQLTSGVAAGELVPRSSVGSATGSGLVELPIAVDPEQVPPSVEAGAVVDVYLVGATSGTGAKGDPGAAADGPVLAAVTVVEAPPIAESFGTTGKRQLVVAVQETDATGFFEALGRYDAPVLTVVRRG
jgi:hypothetical protein